MKKGACDASRPRGFASKRPPRTPTSPATPASSHLSILTYYSIHMISHVSTIQTLPLSLPTSGSARRRAPIPAFHPTTICLLLTIASTYFIACFKQSEATTSGTTTHPSELILAYLSFLCSVLGALSGALSTGPVPRTRYQDRPPANVESPRRPALTNYAFLLGVIFQLTPPRRSIQRMWDFPLICAFSSLMCFIAQVWLYICIHEPCSVQVVGGFAAATALVALRRLRTSLLSSRGRASIHDKLFIHYTKRLHMTLAHGYLVILWPHDEAGTSHDIITLLQDPHAITHTLVTLF
ncbi:hypothetical protein BGY98DRAFT_625054 [Russula aff. rugulosa BPL654]|nr:hypothetical protein BGY98DRAFT_625054 [Russula aff. rugulosa BPL654]